MNLTFSEIEIDKLGKNAGDKSKMWGRVTISFRDEDSDYTLSISMDAVVSKDPSITFGAIQGDLHEKALLLARAAVKLLDKNSIEDLETQQAELEDIRSPDISALYE